MKRQTFAARFVGTCKHCGGAILEGDEITYIEDEIACEQCVLRAQAEEDEDEVEPRVDSGTAAASDDGGGDHPDGVPQLAAEHSLPTMSRQQAKDFAGNFAFLAMNREEAAALIDFVYERGLTVIGAPEGRYEYPILFIRHTV